MNILYYFALKDSYMYKWQIHHLIDELSREGHNVTIFNPLKFRTVSEANDELLQYINKDGNIDLFMCCESSKVLYVDVIKSIKKKGVPTLLICFDNLHDPYKHKLIAPEFDLTWLTSNETKYLFNKWGADSIFLPYASNPHKFYPKKVTKEIRGVGFIGTPYGTRTNKINVLLKNKIECYIYSGSRKTVNNTKKSIIKYSAFFNYLRFNIGRNIIQGYLYNKLNGDTEELLENKYLFKNESVTFEKMSELYSQFALSLNIIELRNTMALNKKIHKLHLRTFEIPMSGGLQICSYNEELASYFDDGDEIILYKDEEELISKAKYYLKPENESERLRIKQNAYKRAKADHKWMNRFNRIFSIIGIS